MLWDIPLGWREWAYLLSILLPLALYDVLLKVLRLRVDGGVTGIIEVIGQLRPELLFQAGYALLWVGIFAVARGRIARKIAVALFHLMAVAMALLLTFAHGFYVNTGSTLGYQTISYALENFRETHAIVAAQSALSSWVILGIGLIYLTAGPAVISRFFREEEGSRSGSRLAALSVCLIGLAVGSLSLFPTISGAGDDLSREALISVAASKFAKPSYRTITPEIQAQVAAENSLDDTRLSPTERTQQRNVVFVFLESTRASATTPYNEELATTPFMQKLAEQSLLAENAHAVVPHTTKALTASHCGITPSLSMQNVETEPGAIPARCLPELLGEQGYDTAFFQSATEEFEDRRQLVKNLGYREFYPLEKLPKRDFEEVNYFGYEDDVMLGPSEEWLSHRDGPFMASYLTVGTHHDYNVPEGFQKQKFVEDEEFNDYLNTIRYQDAFLKKLFEQYKRLGLYENTVFVVVGDHGEGFGEHGLYQHDNTIYEEGLKIPLIVHAPGRFPGGARVQKPANQLDILPTITGLLGFRTGGGNYPGSLLYDLPEGRTTMTSCWHDRTCLASIKGDKKYIYHFDDRPEEFFDLSRDPGERHNLAEKYPVETEQRREELLLWLSRTKILYEEK